MTIAEIAVIVRNAAVAAHVRRSFEVEVRDRTISVRVYDPGSPPSSSRGGLQEHQVWVEVGIGVRVLFLNHWDSDDGRPLTRHHDLPLDADADAIAAAVRAAIEAARGRDR